MKIYYCKFKNHIELQKYIFKKYINLTWYLSNSSNKIRSLSDYDYVYIGFRIFIDENNKTKIGFSELNYYRNIYKFDNNIEFINFEKYIIRKNKFKKILNE